MQLSQYTALLVATVATATVHALPMITTQTLAGGNAIATGMSAAGGNVLQTLQNMNNAAASALTSASALHGGVQLANLVRALAPTGAAAAAGDAVCVGDACVAVTQSDAGVTAAAAQGQNQGYLGVTNGAGALNGAAASATISTGAGAQASAVIAGTSGSAQLSAQSASSDAGSSSTVTSQASAANGSAFVGGSIVGNA